MHNLGSRKCKLGIKVNHFKDATRKKAQEFTRKMLFTFVYHVLPYENVSARIGRWISPPPNRCVLRFRFLVDLSYPSNTRIKQRINLKNIFQNDMLSLFKSFQNGSTRATLFRHCSKFGVRKFAGALISGIWFCPRIWGNKNTQCNELPNGSQSHLIMASPRITKRTAQLYP